MIGSVVEKEDEDNVINTMNKPEIVDSMVENVVKKMMKIIQFIIWIKVILLILWFELNEKLLILWLEVLF